MFVLLEKCAEQSEKLLDIVKKDCAPLRKLFAPWCLKLVTGLLFCLRPLRSCRAPEQCTCCEPPLIAPEPVTQTLSCELSLVKRLQLCLFLKHSHTLALICNVANHNSNK